MSDFKAFYDGKGQDYFSGMRTDILPLLPDAANSVLEVGCGEGATLHWIRTIRKCRLAVGFELIPSAASIARCRADLVIQGNVENLELPFKANAFDLILCLDILEHLVDPWALVRRLTKILKIGGCLIASIPNVKHHSVILPLLFKGQWKYLPSGVLDKTHLRFFTQKTAISLLESSGLCVDMVCSIGRERNSKSRIANILSLGLLKVLFEAQYLIRAVK
jgi:SAM-dependent methyltransferase